MKRFVFGSLSLLLLCASAPSVSAKPAAINSRTAGTTSLFAEQTTPFNLVHLAYRGYFRDRGIPSYNTLLSAIQSGRTDAEEIVKVAIAANRLPEASLLDRSYISSVESQLKALESGTR
jgi:hypothetical protein